jgi:multicomponent Na+:H+ antiporter subunit D
MLIAMGLAAALCIGIGVFPGALYALLPYPVNYVPYTGWHVLAQLQLLVFSALAFSVLMWTRIYPPELRSVNLDSDVLYRRLLPVLVAGVTFAIEALNRALAGARNEGLARLRGALASAFGADGVLGSVRTTSGMVVWVAVLLAAFLILYYF